MITQFPADSSDAKSVAGHPIVVPAPVQPGDDAETVADRPSIVQSPVQPGYDAETVTDRPLIVPALVQPGDGAETVTDRPLIVPALVQPGDDAETVADRPLIVQLDDLRLTLHQKNLLAIVLSLSPSVLRRSLVPKCNNSRQFSRTIHMAHIIIIIIIIITDLYSAFRSEDTEALGAAQED